MKFWRGSALVVFVLGLLCLVACGKKDAPVRRVADVLSRFQPQEDEEPIVESDFIVACNGQVLDVTAIEFGDKCFVERQQISQIFGAALSTDLTISRGGKSFVDLAQICRQLGYELAMDAERHYVSVVQPSWQWNIPEGYEVPVLMYHGVSDEIWGASELFVSPSRMEEQIKYLVDNGFTPIWFEDLEHVEQYEKPVILTYDDGYMDNYLELFPLLQKYQVKATIFVVTGAVDYNARTLTSEQMQQMSDSGLVSFQSHTVTHPLLSTLSEEQQEYELVRSKLDIAQITGKEPFVICYPSGNYNETTLKLAKKYYRMGIDMNGLQYVTGEDPYQVERYYMRRQDSVGTFASYIQ